MYPLIRRYLRRVDVVYLLLCAACSAISVVVLLSIGQTQLGSNNKASVQLIASLLGLMLALGLSMFGVFEIGVKATTMGGELQHKKGYAGSFWSGALATVISTPCSAPFLGQAIGAAMLQPPLGIVLCLTMMGLGMSLPYIVLGAFPVLTKYLPKPGAWMESFKQAMSFLIFGTAAYFLWIYMAFFDQIRHEPIKECQH